ncbi:hypothetical protein D3C72_1531810 [compost metagenome]
MGRNSTAGAFVIQDNEVLRAIPVDTVNLTGHSVGILVRSCGDILRFRINIEFKALLARNRTGFSVELAPFAFEFQKSCRDLNVLFLKRLPKSFIGQHQRLFSLNALKNFFKLWNAPVKTHRLNRQLFKEGMGNLPTSPVIDIQIDIWKILKFEISLRSKDKRTFQIVLNS